MMKVITRSMVFSALGMLMLAAPLRAQETDTTMTTIVDVATEAGNFTTLLSALEAAGLAETLQGDGPYTVFAPTDEAFAKLPEGKLEDLLRPENQEKLRSILLYHVVEGKATASDAAQMSSAATMGGADVTITTAEDAIMINDAHVVTPDLEASNGVIHVIDTVLLPPAQEEDQ